jgi:hypothetical protein
MLGAKALIAYLLFTVPFISLHEIELNSDGDPPIVEKGYSGKRYFADLGTFYTIDSTGKNVLCTLYVSSAFAGIEVLNVSNPTYNFDLIVGSGKAKGALKLHLVDSPLISKLSGNFLYSGSNGTNDSFTFKGDLVGWYSTTK